MKKLAVLISNKGTGTNLQAIIDAVNQHKIKAAIVVVISDKIDAQGIERANRQNIPVELCLEKEQLLSLLQKCSVDYICLAGWMQMITTDVIKKYENHILNVHPGLVPDTMDGTVKNPDGTDALWNKGLASDKAIQNFFDHHATYAGSSIHSLTQEFDFGSVFARCFEKIRSHDTIDSLYHRLKIKEHEIYIQTLQKLCN